jgi:peptidoglycan-associated lipoprotein
MQTRTIFAFAVFLLLGVGCSHAKPKTGPGPEVASATPNTDLPKRAETADATDAKEGDARSTRDPSIYFAFDSSLIAYGAQPVLQEVVALEKASGRTVRVEGNCDERGTTEYNLALGDRRARAAAKYLQDMGVPKQKLEVVTYGSERPKNPGHDEEAWANNRRDDLVLR